MQLEPITILAYAVALLALYVISKLLVLPVKVLGKLLINGLLGGLALVVINLLGGWLHIHIAVNPLNALIVGFLGLPGVILLLAAQMVFLL